MPACTEMLRLKRYSLVAAGALCRDRCRQRWNDRCGRAGGAPAPKASLTEPLHLHPCFVRTRPLPCCPMACHGAAVAHSPQRSLARRTAPRSLLWIAGCAGGLWGACESRGPAAHDERRGPRRRGRDCIPSVRQGAPRLPGCSSAALTRMRAAAFVLHSPSPKVHTSGLTRPASSAARARKSGQVGVLCCFGWQIVDPLGHSDKARR